MAGAHDDPIDFTDALNEVKLRHINIWVVEGHVLTDIRTRYANNLNLVIADATNSSSPHLTKLEDAKTVALSADKRRLLNRHKKEWLKVLGNVIKEFEAKLEVYESWTKAVSDEDDIEAIDSVVARAEARLKNAERALERSKKLIMDLEEHIDEA